jgi:hypothetical protein
VLGLAIGGYLFLQRLHVRAIDEILALDHPHQRRIDLGLDM